MILAELDLCGLSIEDLSPRWDRLSGPEAQKLVARHAVESSDMSLCDRAVDLSLEQVLGEASPVTAQRIVDELVRMPAFTCHQ